MCPCCCCRYAGVRVVCFIASPLLPRAVQGTVWEGMAHSSDWYVTFVEGLAGGSVAGSGARPSDGFNLWPALVSGGASPRHEVVHQVRDTSACSETSSTRRCRAVHSTARTPCSLPPCR